MAFAKAYSSVDDCVSQENAKINFDENADSACDQNGVNACLGDVRNEDCGAILLSVVPDSCKPC